MHRRILIQKAVNFRRPIVIAIIILAVYFLADSVGLLTVPRLKIQDLFVRLKCKLSGPPAYTDQIVIAAIDDVEYQLRGSTWPWDRYVFANLIYSLDEMEPAVIGMTLGFIGKHPGAPQSDIFLKEAFADAGNVILASFFDKDGRYIVPFELFSGAALGYGIASKPLDRDLVIRKTQVLERDNISLDIIDYSFDVKVINAFLTGDPDLTTEKDGWLGLGSKEKLIKVKVPKDGVIPLNYSVPLSSLRVVPFREIINKEIAPEVIKDKILLVGPTADIFYNIANTPLGRMPDVGVLANSILMFLNLDFIYEIPPIACNILLIVAALLVSMGISRTKIGQGVLLLLAVLILFIGVSLLLVLKNIYWDFFSIPLVVLIIYLTSGASHYIQLFMQSLVIRRLATTDTLTRLPTRRYLIFKLENELKTATGKTKLSAVIFKLENYEQILNETSPEKADQIVKSVGRLIANLSRRTRGMDFIARYGETEFCSLLHRTPGKGAEAYAERIIKTITKKITAVSTIIVRAGIADIKDIPYKSAKIFVRCAETALARAQKEGTVNKCVFKPTIDALTIEDYMKGKQISEADLTYVAEEFEARNKELAILLNRIRTLKQDVISSERLSATGKLAAIIHHDLNKPIVNLRRGLKILKEDLLVEEDEKKLTMAKKFVDSSIKETERLESLTWQLKDLYRPREKETGEIAVNPLLEEMLNLSFAQITKRGIKLLKNLAANLPPVIANPGDLKQAFLNLIMNAIEALEKGGELEVRTAMSGKMLEIDIRDTGCGIPKENLDKIFKAFFSTKLGEKEKGSGLGLYATNEIIRRYGGTIKVTSQVDQGTTFKIFLPVKPMG